MAEELKVCRYRVEKAGYGFWPYCVRAGDGTRELFKGHQKQCMVVAAELETAFEDGKFVAERAILPSQGGEAVEVVERYAPAWGADRADNVHCYMSDDEDGAYMTVAQHQRILAASVGSAEPVAWREHSVNYAKGEKCPETIETLQAAWDRDQELINDMRHEIARHKTRINRLEQRRPAGQVAEGVRLDGLVRANLQMGRVYLHFKTTEQQHVALRELRALLNGGRS